MSQTRSRLSTFVARLVGSFLLIGGLSAFPPAAAEAAPTQRVVGYLPEWTAQKPTWDWDLLSDLMIFSGSVNAKAELAVSSGWSSAMVKEAHSHGVRVFLSVRCFNADDIHTALVPGKSQDALVQAIVQKAVVALPGDGAELDFEGMRVADRDALTAFVQRLRQALREKKADAQVALALPAVDWQKAYDIAQLAAEADLLFIMGYAYHYTGSTYAGPVAPLDGGMRWGRYHLRSTVENYLKLAGPAAKQRVVLGLPLYGTDWPTVGPDIGAKTQGDGTAVTYAKGRLSAKSAGRNWDAESSTPWYTYQKDGAWHQVWYEDEESMAAKMDLAIASGLAGVGVWALGYEDASFWSAVRDRFAPLPPAPEPMTPPSDKADAPAPPQASDAPEAAAGAAGCTMAESRRAASPTAPLLAGLVSALLAVRRRRRQTA